MLLLVDPIRLLDKGAQFLAQIFRLLNSEMMDMVARRLTTGRSVVTSAVLPGYISQHNGQPCRSSANPTTDLFEIAPINTSFPDSQWRLRYAIREAS